MDTPLTQEELRILDEKISVALHDAEQVAHVKVRLQDETTRVGDGSRPAEAPAEASASASSSAAPHRSQLAEGGTQSAQTFLAPMEESVRTYLQAATGDSATSQQEEMQMQHALLESAQETAAAGAATEAASSQTKPAKHRIYPKTPKPKSEP